MRDLARKRLFLVRHKTDRILSLQSLIACCSGQRISTNDIRSLTVDDLQHLLKEEHIVLSAQANLDTIVFLKQQILRLEKSIKNSEKPGCRLRKGAMPTLDCVPAKKNCTFLRWWSVFY